MVKSHLGTNKLKVVCDAEQLIEKSGLGFVLGPDKQSYAGGRDFFPDVFSLAPHYQPAHAGSVQATRHPMAL